MNKKMIMFDFDGVLCDSMEAFLKGFEIIAKKNGLNSQFFSRPNSKDLSSRQILKALQVRPWQLPRLLQEGREEIWKRKENLRFFEGALSFIQKYREIHQVLILTSNQAQTVRYLFEREGVKPLPTFGGASLLGKERKILKIMKKYGYSNSSTYYVGDETRDVDAANAANVFSIACSWGYNSYLALSQSKPDYLVSTFSDLEMVLDF